MQIQDELHALLAQIGPGRISSTAYDTAWFARLAPLDASISAAAVAWLRGNQHADGSWGARFPHYHHDRLICTLAAMIALAYYGNETDQPRLERARATLKPALKGLHDDPNGETVGFEMIVPTLLEETQRLGVYEYNGNGTLEKLIRKRSAKIAALPGGMINRHVSAAFSSEMAGPDGLHLLDVPRLQEANGSVGNSPASTAFFALTAQPGDERALAYLRQVATENDGIPFVSPFDVFERAWVLWNLSLVQKQLPADVLAACQPHLDYLERAWVPGQGLGFSAFYTPKDADDTTVAYDVLTAFGRSPDLDSVLAYESETHYRCYLIESNPSISVNIHALGALAQAGFAPDHPSVRKIKTFLTGMQSEQGAWFDKWHASPYYTTTHAVIACCAFGDHAAQTAADYEPIERAIAWILETQSAGGGWGYYEMPTAEETAYCLQALTVWQRQGGQVPLEILQHGAAWLAMHSEPPYPPLWIGKSLYSPELIVRSAVLSALLLVREAVSLVTTSY
ncbi:MAG: cyclase [Chloroflexi bacterium]|nr:cyclase [Chloroflexota bacterium]